MTSIGEQTGENGGPTYDVALVRAVGKLSEAWEAAEEARGHLYAFHRLTGHADAVAEQAVNQLRDAGQGALADKLVTELIGRNVLPGRWTFQIVEEYDDDYHRLFSELEREGRSLVGGRRHVYEAQMKHDRRTHGRSGHEATPADFTA
ncbi:hypothetical protein [Kutzneria buriramensis]|uniref:Uncharacterized protein n=1 Tax=Kutzneria buriramensis TaxID=1045776 RepID=A0A3E0HI91_9PSEU|nr:hypothetical protein [Kutzneria buriramensis]REH46128.1 hypothetical protein BCF44_107261 [Kutzneria buriramensis]